MNQENPPRRPLIKTPSRLDVYHGPLDDLWPGTIAVVVGDDVEGFGEGALECGL